MKKSKEPFNQNSSPQKSNSSFSIQEERALIALFSLLLEIDQQNNVSKEYIDAEQAK